MNVWMHASVCSVHCYGDHWGKSKHAQTAQSILLMSQVLACLSLGDLQSSAPGFKRAAYTCTWCMVLEVLYCSSKHIKTRHAGAGHKLDAAGNQSYMIECQQ